MVTWGWILALERMGGRPIFGPWPLSALDVAATVIVIGTIVLFAEIARAGTWRASDLELLLEEDPNMIIVVREGAVVFANRALRARSMSLEHGPNAWGWYFAPIANLYLPYKALAEVVRHATGRVHASPLVVWWTLWLSASFAMHFSGSGDVPGVEDVPMLVLLAGAALALQRIVHVTTDALARAPKPDRLGIDV
jgi:hypothetical protein